MDKPHYIEDMTKEISLFRGDFNEHVTDDKEWKMNHEKSDHQAFDDLKMALQGLYIAQGDTLREIQALRADLAPSKWFIDGNKGLATIPKMVYLALLLIVFMAIFGIKATVAYLIGFIK